MTEFEKEVIRLLTSIEKKITAQVVGTPMQSNECVLPILNLTNKKNPHDVILS